MLYKSITQYFEIFFSVYNIITSALKCIYDGELISNDFYLKAGKITDTGTYIIYENEAGTL